MKLKIYSQGDSCWSLILRDFWCTLEISLWQLRGWRWHWSWQLDLGWKEEKVKLNRRWWRPTFIKTFFADIGQWKWVKGVRFVIHWSQTKNKISHTHNVPHSTIELYIHNKCPNGYISWTGQGFSCIWICSQLGSKASCGVESAFYWTLRISWPLATQSFATFTSLRWKNIYK